MKKFGKRVAVSVLAGMLTITAGFTALAAEGADGIITSTGSEYSDFDDETPVGKDETQSKVTEYEEKTMQDAKKDTQTVDVYVSKGSTYSIKVPKSVILDGNTGTGDFMVSAKGEIQAEKRLLVSVDENSVSKETSVVMQSTSRTSKSDITATVKQSENYINADTLSTDSYATGARISGNIAAPAEDITVGSWTGAFNIYISLVDAAAE